MTTTAGTATKFMNGNKRILIRRVDNLGDIIIALPVIREIRGSYPRARITLMVRPEHRVLVRQYADAFEDPQPVASLKSLFHKYELVFNIEYSFPFKYKIKKPPRNGLVHIGIPDWRKKANVYAGLLQGLELHGLICNKTAPSFRASCEERAAAKEWLASRNLNTRRDFIVGVNPGSGFPHKRWPAGKFALVCRWLIKEYAATIVIISQTRDDSAAASLFKNLPRRNAIWFHDKPLEFVAAVLDKLDLCLGNDSGLTHLAAAVGTPTVTIFGPTSPSKWKPARKNVSIKKYDCQCTCGYDGAQLCRSQKCLKDLTIHDFADAIILAINKYGKREAKPALDNIGVCGNLRLKATSEGYIMQNPAVPRPLLVNRGMASVSKVLKRIDRVGSYGEFLKKWPGDKKLLNLLLLHRIAVTAKAGNSSL